MLNVVKLQREKNQNKYSYCSKINTTIAVHGTGLEAVN